MISPLIYYSYNILINHNNLSLFIYFSNQVALVKATQKDHAPSGQVNTKIVMDLDTNPTVSHLDKSNNYYAYDFGSRSAIVAFQSRCQL